MDLAGSSGPNHSTLSQPLVFALDFAAHEPYDFAMNVQNEAAPYYSRYINLVPSGNILQTLETQFEETLDFLSGISEEQSLHRYAADKWSIRQVLNHVNDTERVFMYRAFWFARGFDTPLPGYDQDTCAVTARADDFSWANHVEDFRSIRLSTLSFFRNLPAEAWQSSGIASDNPFTVRALAYIAAGHVAHHRGVVQERYL
jgi:uncharacterized damage-inducible protein DinB